MLQALIGSIFGVGLFLILADYFRVPFFKTSKAINNLAKRQEKKTSTLDIWLGDLAMWISKRLRINEFKRMQLEIDLRSAGVNMSPEMHIANSIVKSMLIGILAVPMLPKQLSKPPVLSFLCEVTHGTRQNENSSRSV